MTSAELDPNPDTDEAVAPDARRAGDDPFLPEEGFFWWLPRAMAIVLVGVCLVLLTIATIHHGKYRLALGDADTVLLERGRFSPRGWEAYVPDGAVDAWSPIPWVRTGPELPLDGELRVLSETWLGMLRAHAAAVPVDDQTSLEGLAAREARFESWYSSRWGEPAPGTGSVAELQASRVDRRAEDELRAADDARREEERRVAAEEAAEELARAQRMAADPEGVRTDELIRARDYAASRRALLRQSEDLLLRLPPAGEGSAEQERDRTAFEAFIERMDTPAHLTGRDDAE